MLLLAIAFLAVFLLASSAGLLLFRRSEVAGRLRTTVRGQARSTKPLPDNWLRPSPEALIRFARRFEKVLPRTEEGVSAARRNLTQAGYRQSAAVNVFYGAKILAPLALCAAVTVSGVYQTAPLLVYVLAAGGGLLAPGFWLNRRIARRRFRMRGGLPEALDLMVVCSEAGLGLDQAMYRVAGELRLTQPEIADELRFTILEQNAGRSRREALENLAKRTGLDVVRAFTSTLIQADAFGTSIAKTLRVYSDGLRTQRRQSAEEQAAKTTVKLVFPLVFFIFPSIFVVTIGPAVLQLYEQFADNF